MYHSVKLSTKEKIKAWLSLCEVSYNLIKDNFGQRELFRRFEKMRQEKIRDNYTLRGRLSRIK